jgi:chemotaxis family two-component system sensor histidine kinase/response regulator PixL
VNEEVETLLLQGVDCLRQASNLHRQGTVIDLAWLTHNEAGIFEPLQALLGELQEADENALLQQDEGADPALLVFEGGVEAVLDRFEQQLQTANPGQLQQELALTADELIAFGFMAQLQPFIQLCQSIQENATSVETAQIKALAERSLLLWRRSHALVLRGNLHKLPTQIEGFASKADVSESIDLETVSSEPELANGHEFDLTNLDLSTADFDLASSLGDLWASPETMPAKLPDSYGVEPEPELNELLDFSLEVTQDLAELQDAFALTDLEAEDLNLNLNLNLNLELAEVADNDIEGVAADQAITNVEITAITEAQTLLTGADYTASTPAITPIDPAPTDAPKAQTLRVTVAQLKQFNNLFGKLVLERNTVNLRLDQLKSFVALMRKRIYKLEQSNTKLRKWYDRASLEGIVPAIAPVPGLESAGLNLNQAPSSAIDPLPERFDSLEMDRYSNLHLISQEQIETIVQLQEVSADIDLELHEMTLAIQNLNQTTQSLQSNVTRTQMLSFAEAVKRYPRAVRDLAQQFGKPINLVIEGETTLLDRSVSEALNLPLMHLIRNAFDHGIEDRQTRLDQGKPAKGTIKLSAVNRGTQTIITLQDDGGGIDLNKIRDRVQAMGLSEPEIALMSEADLINCIFEPGFSTAAQVTELSGRGMGMDIVRNALKDIRGDVQVQTKPGLGTTFVLRVPFTLSILRVMLLEQAGIVFAVPADTVQEVRRLDSDWGSADRSLAYLIQNDQRIPLIFPDQHLAFRRPGKPFMISGAPIINQPVALIVGESKKVAGSLYISRHWGEQEVTLRPIDNLLPLPPGFISSIVLGDGRVVPLVDPLQLVEWCLQDRDQASGLDNRQDKRSPQPIELSQIPTVLIVDDSVNVRRYLALTLEKAGYQVEQAKDGQDAVDQLNAGLLVQAVICDIEMPRLDGYGVLEAIKDKPEFQHLPFAMLTSRSNEKHRRLAMNLGASAYFSKPYEEQQLLQTLAELIQQTSSLPSLA